MAKVSLFTNKEVDTKVIGKTTKCKVLELYTIQVVLLHMKDNGRMTNSTDMAQYITITQ